MASISTDADGRRRILFIGADGQRRAIRLGKMPLKAVREIKNQVESLVAADVAGIGWDKETAEWVGTRETILYDKLAAVQLVPKRAETERHTLAAFIDDYLAKRTDIKPRTRINLLQVRRGLVEFFGADKPLADVTEGDADEWRLWLSSHQEKHDGKAATRKLGPNTVRRHCGRARQLFRAALKRRLIVTNPFGEMKGIAVQANAERFYFVSRADAQKVIDACPNAQWRLLFALSRYGGLRCPSEHLALRWGDINWERDRMTIRSPKTEHHEGKGSRVVPLFPELRSYLEQVFDEAEPGTEFVITRYRDGNANLRTHLLRIIAKAGLKPWPKLFQNLRSTRQTELAEQFPAHVICAWIGNSQAIAQKHYLQVTDEHFEAAAKAAQNPAQYEAVKGRNDKVPAPAISGFPEGHDDLRYCTDVQVPPVGLEPTTH